MKKIFKWIPIIVAVIATAVIITVVVKKNSNISEAASATLPGIEEIVVSNSNAHPFTIVEVVADKADGKFGYLVGGEENIDNGRSITDMPAQAEREAKMAAFASTGATSSTFTSIASAGALSFSATYTETSGGATSYEVYGGFSDKENGDYQYSMTDPVYKPWNEYPVGDKYTKYLDWNFGSDCGITFGYVFDASCLTINDGGIDYKIQHKYELYEEHLDTASVFTMNGRVLYEMLIDGSDGADPSKPLYRYAGTLSATDGENAFLVDGNGNSLNIYQNSAGTGEIYNPDYFGDDALYTMLSISNNDISGDYVVRGFTAGIINGAFTKDYHYEVNNDEPDISAYSLYSTTTDNTEYAPGTGNKTFVSNPSGSLISAFSYDGGIVNNEWFKKYTFDISSDFSNFVIDVKTVTVDEFNAISLSGVNMVILSAGTYSEDMSVDQAKSLLKEAINNKLPVIVEEGFDSSASYSTRPNNYKAYTVLRQSGINGLNYGSIESSWDTENFWVSSSTGLQNKKRAIDSTNYAYVDCNVLVVYGSIVDSFNTDVADSLKKTSNNWLSPVLDEINSENFYRQNAGVSLIPTTVSKATAIRYIINYASQRVIVKSKISVLEIEPCYSFDMYTETGTNDNSLLHVYDADTNSTKNVSNANHKVLSTNYIATNWATQFKDTQSNITLTQVSSAEFIGHVEDLNETYDLIYIGLDTSTMNTKIDGSTKTTNTLYNDSNMNGLIYAHVGDTIEDVTGSRSLLGWLWDETDTSKLYWDKRYPGVFKERLSGNDITYEKLMALEEFIAAGYPVVFADGFFNYTGGSASSVNTAYIDVNSNMYTLGQYVLGSNSLHRRYVDYNVMYDSQIKNSDMRKKQLADYLNISKLSVTMNAFPTPYEKKGATTAYLSAIGGHFVLIYDFVLKNEAAVGIYDTNYDVSLYIDTTVDGRFSSDEEIPSIHVYDISSGYENELMMNASGHFELYAGRAYRIRREVPDGYVGILPWKLVFEQNDNPFIRISKTGYTAVPIALENKQQLKVLQITTAEGTNNLNLENDTTVKNLLNQIQDFSISVKTMRSDTLLNSYSTESQFYSYLNQYDMLIFGFSDMYEFGTRSQQDRANTCSKAIKNYINDGKSVLFTHDTSSYFNRDKNFWEGIKDFIDTIFGTTALKSYWGYSFNTIIRPIVGMDRFNATGAKNAEDKVDTYKTKAGDNLSQGYSNIILQRFNNDDIRRSSSRSPFYSSSESTRGGHYSGTYYVSSLNKGQITTYPFEIPDTFQIAPTHGQYYQLNLDTDPWDSNTNDDVVVWYCISDINGASNDDIYQATYKDARNNYYIYSNGNVMYSGMGHSAPNETELKLFINTMVAAYQAGAHAPTVKYTTDEEGGYEISTVYMPYDEALDEYIDTSDVVCNFVITDNSFIKAIETSLENKYFIEVPAGTSGSTKIDYNGTEVTVKEITSSAIVKQNGSNVSNKTSLALDTQYTLTVPVDTIREGFASGKTDANLANSIRIFIGAKTKYKLASGKNKESSYGYYSMTVVRTSLFDLE